MERDWYAVGWKMLLFRGVLGIVFGILAIAWPIETAIAFALLWGIWALADGVGSIVQAFQPERRAGSKCAGTDGPGRAHRRVLRDLQSRASPR